MCSFIILYIGPKLYKQPATKSNRGIILNAVEYCVFPGVVNRDAKQKVLEKIARSEAKHFLVLFRDAGCQFRALYGYWPENETVLKLYGTGPSQVDEFMFDKFFKYVFFNNFRHRNVSCIIFSEIVSFSSYKFCIHSFADIFNHTWNTQLCFVSLKIDFCIMLVNFNKKIYAFKRH